MRRGVLAVFVFILLLAGGGEQLSASEAVDSYDIHISIQEDSSIEVRESIEYTFGAEAKKGIYRTIPIIFERDESRYKLEIDTIEAYDDGGSDQLFDITRGREEIRIDLGSDTPEFDGTHVFHIEYTVHAALEHAEDRDTLNWNAIGTDWSVPIHTAQVTVDLPGAVEEEELESACFVGILGSDDPCHGSEYEYDDEGAVTRIQYGHTETLLPGSGMTVEAHFPKGLVTEAEKEEVPHIPWLFFALLAAAGLVPLYGVRVLYRAGADPGGEKAITTRYTAPDGVVPSDAGIVLNREFGNKELVAELLSLATRGYIKMIHGKRTYLFFFTTSSFLFLKRKPDDDLPPVEKLIMERIFDERFRLTESEAREHFSTDIPGLDDDISKALAITSPKRFERSKKTFAKYFKEIRKKAQDEAFKEEYFEMTFSEARSFAARVTLLSLGAGAALVALIVLVVVFMYPITPLDTFFGALLTGGFFYLLIMIFLFAGITDWRLPRRTQKGAEIRRHMEGLKRYIHIAERERMEFHFDPRKNADLFEGLLPYAVVLGEQKSWTTHLSELKYDPEWYGSSTPGSLSVGGLNSVVKDLSSTSSKSGGSSGGSSGVGGGAGGGGGGSR